MKKFLSKITGKVLLFLYFGWLILVLTGIGIMNQLGYRMINSGLEYTLLTMLICSVIILLTCLLVRRMNSRVLKWIFGALGSVLTFGVGLVLLNFFMFLQIYNSPGFFTYLKSPAGETAVVLRGIDMQEEQVRARAELRRANNPESSMDEFVFEDFGYSYSAYPRKLRYFYDADADVSGEIVIGCDSAAILMNEWLDDDTLHLFIQDPEANDFGEWTLNMN